MSKYLKQAQMAKEAITRKGLKVDLLKPVKREVDLSLNDNTVEWAKWPISVAVIPPSPESIKYVESSGNRDISSINNYLIYSGYTLVEVGNKIKHDGITWVIETVTQLNPDLSTPILFKGIIRRE